MFVYTAVKMVLSGDSNIYSKYKYIYSTTTNYVHIKYYACISAQYSVALGTYCEELALDNEMMTKRKEEQKGTRSPPREASLASLWITHLALVSGFGPWIPF